VSGPGGDGRNRISGEHRVELETEIERQRCAGVPEEDWIAAEQVKEKFGTLRFYLSHNPGDEAVRARIEKAIESARRNLRAPVSAAARSERCGREVGCMSSAANVKPPTSRVDCGAKMVLINLQQCFALDQ